MAETNNAAGLDGAAGPVTLGDRGATADGDERADLKQLLSQLPSETSHDYELAMAKLAAQVRRLDRESQLESLMADADEKIQYGAFYCLCTILRTNRDYTILEQFMERHGDPFRNRQSYRHLELLTRVGLLDRFTDPDEFIRAAYEHAQSHPGNAGYIHMFAGVVALVMEAEEGSKAQVGREWLERALDAALKAVELDRSYAKFHSTLGRLRSLNGDYAGARREFDRAVDLESSSRADYSLRITNYEAQRMRNSLRESGAAVAAEIRATRADAEARMDALGQSMIQTIEENRLSLAAASKRIDESSTRNLEFLGFFAAILSFTIGSIQIAISLTPSQAARLIIVLMGVLMGVFAGFGLLVSSPSKAGYLRAAIVFTFGSLIVLSTFLLPGWPTK
ncbi:tetratricopeptide repeat protein [Kribbella sp. NPDC051586]|uniref:tetratricopeptide repeat protein n=1 Tax=Kribbella sp. NPDC051586 TaxID=3364118 RepID=UPI0037B95FFE